MPDDAAYGACPGDRLPVDDALTATMARAPGLGEAAPPAVAAHRLEGSPSSSPRPAGASRAGSSATPGPSSRTSGTRWRRSGPALASRTGSRSWGAASPRPAGGRARRRPRTSSRARRSCWCAAGVGEPAALGRAAPEEQLHGAPRPPRRSRRQALTTAAIRSSTSSSATRGRAKASDRQDQRGRVLAQRQERVADARGGRRGGRAQRRAPAVQGLGGRGAEDRRDRRRDVGLEAGLADEQQRPGDRVHDGAQQVQDVVDARDLVAHEVGEEEGARAPRGRRRSTARRRARRASTTSRRSRRALTSSGR